ncbi:MAG: serine/threonine protein kinase [Deltaproteobacteria bacterium]|nr:serine/threonine protein kinase [Deltaproteobacteria bacterium]
MLVCPSCLTTYPPGQGRCERDGSMLLWQDDRCGTVIGNYRIIGLLGRGGMGVVYRASHVYIDKAVAVKILHERYARHEEAVQRFLREAKAASHISHPNIVDVTDFGVLPEGGVYFVMEYLEGQSLDNLVASSAPLPLLRSINIVNQIALALGAAHAKGIVHRDLKPENILLIQRPGRRDLVYRAPATGEFVVEPEKTFDFVKVLDFGVAKVHEVDDAGGSGTMAGTIFGTPQYISPEQARADEDVDHRADVYALGILFYELLTGRVPFDGESAVEILARQIQELPLPPSAIAPQGAEITPAAERLILRAIEKDPARRQQSMAEFCMELKQCFGDVRYRRDARQVPGAVDAGIDPRLWSRPAPEAAPVSRLRPRRLTDELQALLVPPPVPSPPVEAPRRKRLTDELQALFRVDEPVPPASTPADVVVEPVEAIPASELSSRVRVPRPPTPPPEEPPVLPDVAPAPARLPGQKSPHSRTALGRVVVAAPPPAAPPPEPPAAPPPSAAPDPPAQQRIPQTLPRLSPRTSSRTRPAAAPPDPARTLPGTSAPDVAGTLPGTGGPFSDDEPTTPGTRVPLPDDARTFPGTAPADPTRTLPGTSAPSIPEPSPSPVPREESGASRAPADLGAHEPTGAPDGVGGMRRTRSRGVVEPPPRGGRR